MAGMSSRPRQGRRSSLQHVPFQHNFGGLDTTRSAMPGGMDTTRSAMPQPRISRRSSIGGVAPAIPESAPRYNRRSSLGPVTFAPELTGSIHPMKPRVTRRSSLQHFADGLSNLKAQVQGSNSFEPNVLDTTLSKLIGKDKRTISSDPLAKEKDEALSVTEKESNASSCWSTNSNAKSQDTGSVAVGNTQHSDLFVPKEEAEHAYEEKFQGSHIEDMVSDYPRFEMSELKIGKLLGQGGFATVCEVRGIKLPGARDDDSVCASVSESVMTLESLNLDDVFDSDKAEELNRIYLAKHCIRRDTRRGDARYAIKQLRPDVVTNEEKFCMGMIDMATEMRVLSSLQHPNIVKLRARARTGQFDENNFIIMDRLYDTLTERVLNVWKKQSKSLKRWRGKIFDRKGERGHKLWNERLTAAFDLAAGLAHMHNEGIFHRDIKPENIGFDIRDDVKIFDFGLAKEVPKDRDRYDLWHFTSMVGSPRYMAPEVALGKPYNEYSDSYSFALLIWFILALKVPYGDACTMDYMHEHVWIDLPHRPPMDESWSPNLKDLFSRSWNSLIEVRPSMAEMKAQIYQEILDDMEAQDEKQKNESLKKMKRRIRAPFKPKSCKSIMEEPNSSKDSLQNWLDISHHSIGLEQSGRYDLSRR